MVDTSAGRLAALVCYDLEFPEFVRRAAEADAELIVAPVNWPLLPRPDGERPLELLKAQAYAGAYRIGIAIADRCGTERGVDWIGGSAIIGADGYLRTPAPEAGPGAPSFAIALVEHDFDRQLGPHNHALGDRRPDLYGPGGPELTAPASRRTAAEPLARKSDNRQSIRMQLTPSDKDRLGARLTVLKEPPGPDAPAQQDPRVVATVSSMLAEIERDGLAAVRAYAERLDGWAGGDDFEVSTADIDRLTDPLPEDLKRALDAGAQRTRRFAELQREHLVDFEAEVIDGVVCGQRYVPISNVGAYLPAGRFPLLASAFMTVGVARAARVPNVVSCTPPSNKGQVHPAVLYAAKVSGAQRVFALGGVQALAAMAFGLLDGVGADMIVGAGNAFVAEAKRQLYGRVGIDVLAGPSEVAVIADEGASAAMVAADLLAQAEHGPQSPASLVTTSLELGKAVLTEMDLQLAGLDTREIAGAAWRDYGTVYVTDGRESAAQAMDALAPEHLEILADDTDWYLANLTNYGSLFLGPWSTVAYADKGMSGTNHVLPTARGARYTEGLSVARFLKQLTYQKATKEATRAQAEPVVTISSYEQMPGHRDSAQLRLDLL